MNRKEHGLMLVLCGLPGSGKSTFARLLVELAQLGGCPLKHIHFDEALDKAEDFDPSLWKVSRYACMEEAGRLLDDGYIVVMDDTMHYRSMRLQCWRTARLHSSCYCQVLLNCPFSVCYERNALRSGLTRVPSDVMDRMQQIFEAPKQGKYPWDSLTIEVDTRGNVEHSMSDIWTRIISDFWNDPAPPLETETEIDQTIRQLTTETFTHQVDIQSRKIIGEYVGRLLSPDLKGKVALLMNRERQTLLDACRKSCGERSSPQEVLDEFEHICSSITCQYDA